MSFLNGFTNDLSIISETASPEIYFDNSLDEIPAKSQSALSISSLKLALNSIGTDKIV